MEEIALLELLTFGNCLRYLGNATCLVRLLHMVDIVSMQPAKVFVLTV